MTELLLQLFAAPQSGGQPDRGAVGKLSGVVGIVCNLLLFGFKLLVGTLSGSVSITADAMNNLSDASSSIVTLLGFRLAEKPADADHPYGHARFEYLSGLGVAAMILIIGFELAKTSVEKIINPAPVEFTVPVAVVLICSIGLKLWMCLFNKKLGNRIGSPALLATSADSRNDAISTAAVLFAALVERISGWQIDGFMGLLVALFILYSGINLARETISPLLGENGDPELQSNIVKLVTACPQVLGYHDLMVHDYGPGQRFASMHVEMDRREDAMFCHELIDNLERKSLEALKVHLVIHYDPVVVGDPETDRLRESVLALLQQHDPRMKLHDFRMVKGTDHTNLIFDAVLPYDWKGSEKALQSDLEAELTRQEGQRIYTVITFDKAGFNQ